MLTTIDVIFKPPVLLQRDTTIEQMSNRPTLHPRAAWPNPLDRWRLPGLLALGS